MFRSRKEKIQTFTYFIPAPPLRKTGYRETEFDKIVSHLLSLDFEIIDLKTESVSTNQSSGIWIICLIRALTKKAAKLELDFDYKEISNQKAQNGHLDNIIYDE